MALWNRSLLPDEALTRLNLSRDDKVLDETTTTDGWAVASAHGIHVVPADGEPISHPWSDVDGARMMPEDDEITVTWVDGSAPSTIRLQEWDRRFARTVYDRVQSSVVHREVVRLPSGQTVRVVARRVADGGLVTQVIGQGDVDLADPATAEVVDAAEARVRDAVGL